MKDPGCVHFLFGETCHWLKRIAQVKLYPILHTFKENVNIKAEEVQQPVEMNFPETLIK